MRLRAPVVVAALAASALTAGTTPVSAAPVAKKACLKVGVYQDKPQSTYAKLAKAVGPGVKTVSTYVTQGRPVDPKLLKLVKKRKLTLIVSWLPDSGSDGANQSHYRLSNVIRGDYDGVLSALTKQLSGVKKVVFRPMPDPNTPWYAWSGTVNKNTPASYSKAWKHVRKVVKSAGGKKIKFLWSVYARSIPDSKDNQITTYFPGKSQVDYVGADAYNFGAVQGLKWTAPVDLFAPAYGAIEKLAAKPFWIAETGSTATGGDQTAWIGSLAGLAKTMPQLAGVVWYDVKDSAGDFRLKGQSASAFKTLLSQSCK